MDPKETPQRTSSFTAGAVAAVLDFAVTAASDAALISPPLVALSSLLFSLSYLNYVDELHE